MASAMAMATVAVGMVMAAMVDITVVMATAVAGVTIGLPPFWAPRLWVAQFTQPAHLATSCLNKWWCSSNMRRLVGWRISAQQHSSTTPRCQVAKYLGSS